MTLPVPNLDDRSFDQLLAEAQALIPRYLPTWTDHNPSDPGIALIEVFAFLSEIAIYQTNRVPERSLENFAALVGTPRKRNENNEIDESIEQNLRRSLLALQSKYRAITQTDFEKLIQQEFKDKIARTVVLVGDTIIKIVIVPKVPETEPAPIPTTELRQELFEFLRERRLITTRIQVLPPQYIPVRIALQFGHDFSSRISGQTVVESVKKAIERFLKPLTGGIDGQGWEFGRSLFRSELYQLIEAIPGVDHVHQLKLDGNETLGAIPLSATALVRLVEPLSITTVEN